MSDKKSSSFKAFVPRQLTSAQVAAAEGVSASIPATGEIAMRKETVAASPTSTSYLVGQSYDVPLSSIEANPLGPRVIYAQADVDSMQEKLETSGQQVSVLGFVNESGGITLLDGETRFRASMQARLKTLRVEVCTKPASLREMYERSRNVNVDRNQQTPFDDGYRWKDMLEKGVYASQTEIAAYSGINAAEVSRRIQLADIPVKFIQFIYDYPHLRQNSKMLDEIRKYLEVASEDETRELVLEVVKYELGAREVAARRAALIASGSGESQATSTRPRARAMDVSFKSGKGVIKMFKDRLELTIKGLTEEDAAEVQEKIKEVLARKAE